MTNLLLDTDYPLDKVVYLESGSFSAPALTQGTIEIVPHNLPFTPLCSGNWSLSSGFTVQYEYSTGVFPSTAPGQFWDTICNVFADDTNIYISCDNYNGSSKTIYYRVFGFQPPDDTSDVDPISSEGDQYLLSTDYNNAKLFLSDTVSLPAAPSAPTNVAVEHNLGYIPQAMGWCTYTTPVNGDTVLAIHPFGTSNGASQGILMSVNSTYINFSVPQFATAQTGYYRLYLDE